MTPIATTMPVQGINGLWLLLFAVLTLAIAHGVMYALRRNELWHRCAVFLATLLGGIALISGTYDSQEKVASWQIPAFEQLRNARFDQLVEQLEFDQEYYCGFTPTPSPLSPPDIDHILSEMKEMCRLSKAILAQVPRVSANHITFTVGELDERRYSSSVVSESRKTLTRLILEYDQAEEQIRRLRSEADPTPLEATLTVMGPYLLTLAFSFGLASITFPAKPAGRIRSRRSTRVQ